MRCFYPVSAYKTDSGDVIFYDRNGRDRSLQIRCGQCIGCRISRSQDWAVRCVNEKSLSDSSVFLTLTFKNAPIFSDVREFHRPFQLFMKKLRFARKGERLSYFMCGEYGERFERPHYHALVFNCGFGDRKLLKTNPVDLYRSPELERLWPLGFSSIGDVTLESAQYVAGYVVGRKTGKGAEDHYQVVDLSSGELRPVSPEYGRMSLRPGIGARFFDKFHHDVTVRDSAVVNGREYKPPKYYDRRLEKIDGFKLDELEYERYKTALELETDSTPARLQVQEAVVKSRMALKRRLLEF